MVGVESVDERLDVSAGDDAPLDAGAVTHDGEDARAEDLQTVEGTVFPAHARRAAMTGAHRLLVTNDRVGEDAEQARRIVVGENVERRGSVSAAAAVVVVMGRRRRRLRRRRRQRRRRVDVVDLTGSGITRDRRRVVAAQSRWGASLLLLLLLLMTIRMLLLLLLLLLVPERRRFELPRRRVLTLSVRLIAAEPAAVLDDAFNVRVHHVLERGVVRHRKPAAATDRVRRRSGSGAASRRRPRRGSAALSDDAVILVGFVVRRNTDAVPDADVDDAVDDAEDREAVA